MSFTQEEIEFMDKEVDEDMEEQDVVFEDAGDAEDEEDEDEDEDEEDVDDILEYGTKIQRLSSDSDDSVEGKIYYYQHYIIYSLRHNLG